MKHVEIEAIDFETCFVLFFSQVLAMEMEERASHVFAQFFTELKW